MFEQEFKTASELDYQISKHKFDLKYYLRLVMDDEKSHDANSQVLYCSRKLTSLGVSDKEQIDLAKEVCEELITTGKFPKNLVTRRIESAMSQYGNLSGN